MFKIVKSAQIEVIKPSELKVGDYILWSCWKRKVTKINKLNRFITVTNPIDNSEESLNMFLSYYRIISCEEIEAPSPKE
jgi:hypothetical protein